MKTPNQHSRTTSRLFAVAVALSAALIASSTFATEPVQPKAQPAPRVVISTPYGRIVAEVYVDKAPITAANFLRYVDEKRYDGATFYRALRRPELSVIQGGIDPSCRNPPLPPIAHESTKTSGLKHIDGVLSMARNDPGTAGSEFFIMVGASPDLDAGGRYDPGYAAFGLVIEGMEIVRKINGQPTGKPTDIEYLKGDALMEPVPIRVERLPSK